jgi:hypothetical protein
MLTCTETGNSIDVVPDFKIFIKTLWFASHQNCMTGFTMQNNVAVSNHGVALGGGGGPHAVFPSRPVLWIKLYVLL